MILVSRINQTILCPKGDTGLLRIRILKPNLSDTTYAKFYIYNSVGTVVLQKIVKVSNNIVAIAIQSEDTSCMNLGMYRWNCTIYQNAELTSTGDLLCIPDKTVVDTLFYKNPIGDTTPYFILKGANHTEHTGEYRITDDEKRLLYEGGE